MSSLVDAQIASRVATKFAAQGPLGDSYLLDNLDESLKAIVLEAEPLIEEETGFAPSTPAVALALSRSDWATANIHSMLTLISGLLEKMEQKIDLRPVSPMVRMTYGPVLGAQMGAVLGFLSQRVLGQYDVIEGHQDEVWFVGPNMVLMERKFGFVPRDFRLWVAVHELTHRAQFEGNAWIREYFLTTVNALIEGLDIEPTQIVRRLAGGIGRPSGDAPIALRWLEPEQIDRFNSLQAFMSLIEGHANFVMDRVAPRAIPTQPRMRETLKGGGSLGGGLVGKLLGKLLGLELKKAQYKQGQEFCDRIFEAAGQQAIAACFNGPEQLPTLEEVKDPKRWLARVQP